MTSVQVRLPDEELKQIDRWVKAGRFTNRSDAIRTIVSIYEDQERKRKAFETFSLELRKIPGKKTKKERQKTEKELKTMSQEDLLRLYGLDKVPDARKSRRVSSDD